MTLVEYVTVLENDPEESPACSHGPGLLFDRVGKQFFACSACRDRKLCPLYVEYGSKRKFKTWKQIRDRHVPAEPHRGPPTINEGSRFCPVCCRIYSDSENICSHRSSIQDISVSKAKSPSTFLAQLSANKGHAQYHFEENTLNFIVDLASRFDKVLCLGTPSVFERLRSLGVVCHLADIDRRLEAFYGPDEFTWFNMLNTLAFREERQSFLWKFVTQTTANYIFQCTSIDDQDSKEQNLSVRSSQTSGRMPQSDRKRKIDSIEAEISKSAKIETSFCEDRLGSSLVIVDPPFGGLLVPLSRTIKDLTKVGVWNRILVFPYFNEAQVNLHFTSTLKMCDFAVRYRNQRKMKDSSPVRLFTDIPLGKINLPESSYKYCPKCARWVHIVNRHCDSCNICPSKNHSPFQHCVLCQRCVKQTWSHCPRCERCHLTNACGVHRGTHPTAAHSTTSSSYKTQNIRRRKKRK